MFHCCLVSKTLVSLTLLVKVQEVREWARNQGKGCEGAASLVCSIAWGIPGLILFPPRCPILLQAQAGVALWGLFRDQLPSLLWSSTQQSVSGAHATSSLGCDQDHRKKPALFKEMPDDI